MKYAFRIYQSFPSIKCNFFQALCCVIYIFLKFELSWYIYYLNFKFLKNKIITHSDLAYYQNIPCLQYDAQAAAFFRIFI